MFSRNKQKSHRDAFRSLRLSLENLSRVDGEHRKAGKLSEEVTRCLTTLEAMIGAPGHPHPPGTGDVVHGAMEGNFLPLLVGAMKRLSTEGRKATTQVIKTLVEWTDGENQPIVEYLDENPETLWLLLKGYEIRETALPCGGIIRECARQLTLARRILNSPNFYRLFRYIDTNLFDISTDAFCTFKDLLIRHKRMSAEFLDENYHTFFEYFQDLIRSDNYVTRRQSLELLGKLILERHNFNVMIRFISDKDNLKLIMRMFQQPCRATQYECFHVFKVFVANPSKPKPVQDLLRRNRDEIIRFITAFQNDRAEDEQFRSEKEFIIKQIKEL